MSGGRRAWTKGTPKALQSSSVAERNFCGDCGTPLSYHQLGGANMEILLGAFDNPNALAPAYAVGIESKVAWFNKLHELPARTFAEYAGGCGREREEPSGLTRRPGAHAMRMATSIRSIGRGRAGQPVWQAQSTAAIAAC
mgnify:FL=1